MIGLPELTLVLGGARSGKSAFAEGLAVASGRPLTYVATARAGDGEMADRIAAHQRRRGNGWDLIEEPLDLAGALEVVPAGRVVLIDCLTLWLSNLMLAGRRPEVSALFSAPGRGPVILVSAEVGLGLVPETRLGRDYRDALGELNQAVAARAGLVVFVAAGLPMVLKGRLP